MHSDSLRNVADALRNVAGALAEVHRQEGAGAKPPFEFVGACLDQETARLRAEGQPELAEALAGLRGCEGGTENG